MTLSGTVTETTASNQPRFWFADKIVAAGENCVYTIQITENKLMKLNLKTAEVSELTLNTNAYRTVALESQVKNGYLYLRTLYTKTAESEGSRYLYLQRHKIDLTDFTLSSSSTEKQITGISTIDKSMGWTYRLIPYGNTLFLGHYDKNNLIRLDLNQLKAEFTSSLASGHNFATPKCWMSDRTTGKLYLFYTVHYWVPGDYSLCGFYDPINDSFTECTSYDGGCGAMAAPKFYLDSDDKFHFIFYGASCGYTADSYCSKWSLLYIDNGALQNEITTISAYPDYTSGTGGQIPPFPLGLTPDNTLALVTISKMNGEHTGACDLLETTDMLGSPTKISHITFSADSTTKHIGRPPYAFLLEDDWKFRFPISFTSYDDATNRGTLHIGVVDVSTDIEINPYSVLIVPETGVTPTTLTLTVTKV